MIIDGPVPSEFNSRWIEFDIHANDAMSHLVTLGIPQPSSLIPTEY